MTETAASIATSLDRAPSRVARREIARLARGLAGSWRLPGRADRRLRRLAERAPPRIAVFGLSPVGQPRALLVSNDLSASGAPKLLHDIALMLIERGWSVTVLSPLNGAFREPLVAAGASVIIDPALEVDRSIERGASPLLARLAGAAEMLICNTIDTFPAVQVLAGKVPTLWYIHEVSLLRHRLATAPGMAQALAAPRLLWAGSELPAAILREVREDVAVVPYGLDPLDDADAEVGEADGPLRIAIFGSYEPRKGQDLAVAAMASLASPVRAQISLTMYGRVLFPDFHAELARAAAPFPEITVAGELGPDAYRQAVLELDAVLVSSRDDTLPLVSLDALGAGRVLMCTATTGTSAALRPGESGFIADAPTAEAIAAMLTEAVARRRDWPAVGEAGRGVFASVFSKAAFAERLNKATAALRRAAPR